MNHLFQATSRNVNSAGIPSVSSSFNNHPANGPSNANLYATSTRQPQLQPQQQQFGLKESQRSIQSVSPKHAPQGEANEEEKIGRFRVVVRIRPFLDMETAKGGKKGKIQCAYTGFPGDEKIIQLVRPGIDSREFQFDQIVDTQRDQDFAYDRIAHPVVTDVLTGFNGVIMAYGQTGSGKTHTIFGSKPCGELNYQSGIVPRAVHNIFDFIKQNPNKAQFRVTISFLEIYMEQITDLLVQTGSTSQPNFGVSTVSKTLTTSSLSPLRSGYLKTGSQTSLQVPGQNLQIREDPKTGIFVHGLTQVHVKNVEQLLQQIALGIKRRHQNATKMNKDSSRSHAMLQIFVEQRWIEKDNPSGEKPGLNMSASSAPGMKKRFYRKALLSIVDLAGSERLSKTGSEGTRLAEAKTINKSIAALSNCVSALAQNKTMNFVPFRDSKLTRLLTESLGGNCKTTICACVSPSLLHYDESFSTLLFATRAMSVQTRVVMNERVEVRYVDESGRPVSPSPYNQNGSYSRNNDFTMTNNGQSANMNEQKLIKQNSQLLSQTKELRNEVDHLKETIRRQNMMSGGPTSINLRPPVHKVREQSADWQHASFTSQQPSEKHGTNLSINQEHELDQYVLSLQQVVANLQNQLALKDLIIEELQTPEKALTTVLASQQLTQQVLKSFQLNQKF